MRSASLERMERAAAGEDEKLLDEQPQASNASNQHDVRGKRLLFILAALCIALVSFAAGMLFGITIQGSLTVPSDEGDAQAVPQGRSFCSLKHRTKADARFNSCNRPRDKDISAGSFIRNCASEEPVGASVGLIASKWAFLSICV